MLKRLIVFLKLAIKLQFTRSHKQIAYVNVNYLI